MPVSDCFSSFPGSNKPLCSLQPSRWKAAKGNGNTVAKGPGASIVYSLQTFLGSLSNRSCARRGSALTPGPSNCSSSGFCSWSHFIDVVPPRLGEMNCPPRTLINRMKLELGAISNFHFWLFLLLPPALVSRLLVLFSLFLIFSFYCGPLHMT